MTDRRWYWALAASAALVNPVVVFVVGAFTPGTDVLRDYISDLGVPGQPLAAWYVAGGAISTLLNLALAAAWLRRWRTVPWSAVPIIAYGLFFVVHLIGAAIFPCDLGCAREEATGQVHYALGVTAFSLTAVVYFGASLVAWRLDHPRQIVLHGTMLVAAGLTLWLLAADLTGSLVGLAERLTMLAFTAWTLVFAGVVSVPAVPATRSTRPT